MFKLLKNKGLYLCPIRYILGLTMIFYAITKIFRTQFILIPFSGWEKPLETISGKGLAWAFLGYSPWFGVLIGFLELLPGILLLFRRTTLAGAILLLPMTLNVFLINHALNLWDGTKTISLVLLLLNLAVFLFKWQQIKTIASIIVCYGQKFKATVWEISINSVLIAAVSIASGFILTDYIKQTNVLTGDWYHQRPVGWTLQTGPNDNHHQKIYFGSYGNFTQVSDTSVVYNEYVSYKLEEAHHQLRYLNADHKQAALFSYTISGDTLLKLSPVDSAKGAGVLVFRKFVIHAGR